MCLMANLAAIPACSLNGLLALRTDSNPFTTILDKGLELEYHFLAQLRKRRVAEVTEELDDDAVIVLRHSRHHVTFHLQIVLLILQADSREPHVQVVKVIEPEFGSFAAIKQSLMLYPVQGNSLPRQWHSTSPEVWPKP
ncbi:hypothetical protein MHU86_24443 [Fragilaria crotonensis]|nr:hypothetical protein MHU86_24443 [Fragilaria crotonensis]